jgi:hypothetical protein
MVYSKWWELLIIFDQVNTCQLMEGCAATPVGSEVHPYALYLLLSWLLCDNHVPGDAINFLLNIM